MHPGPTQDSTTQDRARPVGSWPPSPSRIPGPVLGNRYRVLEQAGTGGTAEVLLAIDQLTTEPVAIKRLSERAAQVPELRRRFLREAAITQSVSHPAVVRVLDVSGLDDEPPYFVMEALQGETLGDYLRNEQSMPEELALELLEQAASALDAVHRAGIVHRDVKPDNLFLLGPPGSPQGLRLLDFGMAKLHCHAPPVPGDFVVGTVRYMAPEQILGERIDPRTDVYSLGVVAFRILTGHLPFDAEPPARLLGHQLLSPAPPPSWLVEDLSPDLEAVVLRALKKHPDNRYPSMELLRRDLASLRSAGTGASLLYARQPLQHDPDRYLPQTERGRAVALGLARALGVSMDPELDVASPESSCAESDLALAG